MFDRGGGGGGGAFTLVGLLLADSIVAGTFLV